MVIPCKNAFVAPSPHPSPNGRGCKKRVGWVLTQQLYLSGQDPIYRIIKIVNKLL